jgi:hypothetical protein
MDRTEAIGTLAQALAAAGAASDWARLDALTRALAPQLQALAAEGPWSVAELAALTRLRAAHDSAAAACSGALAMVTARLDEMRNNKEGWIAYALASQTDVAEQTT